MARDASVSRRSGAVKRRAAMAAMTTAKPSAMRPMTASRPTTFSTARARNVYGSERETVKAYSNGVPSWATYSSGLVAIASGFWPARGGAARSTSNVESPAGMSVEAPLLSWLTWPKTIRTSACASESARRLANTASSANAACTCGLSWPVGVRTSWPTGRLVSTWAATKASTAVSRDSRSTRVWL